MFLRKISVLLFLIFILSGCATYKFQKPATGSSQGYLVSYDNKPIIEYTVGKEKALPDLTLAKERFKRRRPTVEYYYKNMGQINSRFKEYFWDNPAMLVDFVGGVLRWPFTAVADYRYNHNPKYKERVDRLDEEKESFEKARISNLKEKLEAYITEDLAKEHLPESTVTAEPVTLRPEPQATASPAIQVSEQALPPVVPVPAVAPLAEVKPPVKPTPELPVAVIIAKPAKGYSALKVNFSGRESYSKSGKIISYLWDFGDGDTSTKKNPENTYWSTTYGVRKFIVTLTVKDEAGGISSATAVIEVSTP